MEIKIVTDIEEVINYSLSYQAMNPHHPIQIEMIEKSDYKEFLEFCHQLAEYEFIDELSGGWSRKRSNTLKFEDVINNSPTGSKCGMKVIHFPQYIELLKVFSFVNFVFKKFIFKKVDGFSSFHSLFAPSFSLSIKIFVIFTLFYLFSIYVDIF